MLTLVISKKLIGNLTEEELLVVRRILSQEEQVTRLINYEST
jgi:hypothetical protein